MNQNDETIEKVWTYRDKSNCNGVYLNFAVTEPSSDTLENCVRMNKKGEWEDIGCDTTCNIACQFEITRKC